MKVGILGSGIVGKTLAKGFLQHDYEVMVGTRDVSKLEKLIAQTDNKVKTGSFKETAAFADLIVHAGLGSAAIDILKLATRKNIKGKTIIDANNPIADVKPENGVINFFTTLNRSLLEDLQNYFPEANFVKAFNNIGSALMVNPDFGALKPSMFIAGNKLIRN